MLELNEPNSFSLKSRETCQPRYVETTATNDHQLTGREVEVLTWVALGKSNSAIAAILGISTHTVDTYVRRVMKKFDVASRTTAAVRASQYGLLPRI